MEITSNIVKRLKKKTLALFILYFKMFLVIVSNLTYLLYLSSIYEIKSNIFRAKKILGDAEKQLIIDYAAEPENSIVYLICEQLETFTGDKKG